MWFPLLITRSSHYDNDYAGTLIKAENIFLLIIAVEFKINSLKCVFNIISCYKIYGE